MRTALEMRIMAGSDVTLAPQRGNAATCSIEVLTLAITDKNSWDTYAQRITDAWSKYTDPRTGKPLKIRPHWAKMWQGYKAHGQDMETYFKQVAYKDEIPEFRQSLEAITSARGSTLADTRKVFSNPLFERLFFS